MSSEITRKAEAGIPVWRYERRCTERTLLHKLVTEHYPRFIELLAVQGRSLPKHVQREFDDFLKCGILEYGFRRGGVGGYLEREGMLVRDMENSYLQLEAPDESAMNDLLGYSITYRIAVGPYAGSKAFTLQTVPAREGNSDNNSILAKAASFFLHAGVAVRAHQRRKLERLYRYIARFRC